MPTKKELEKEVANLKYDLQCFRERITDLERSVLFYRATNKALRGVITRMKNKAQTKQK